MCVFKEISPPPSGHLTRFLPSAALLARIYVIKIVSTSAIFIKIGVLNCQIYALKTFLLHSDVNNIDVIVRFACFLLSSVLTGVRYILGHEPVSRTH